jgi:hypothetical protein
LEEEEGEEEEQQEMLQYHYVSESFCHINY